MSSRFYRLRQETPSISVGEKEEKGLVTIPANGEIEGPAILPETALVRVVWAGKELSLFTFDLKQRGEVLA
jgi:hypothetical protein